MSRWTHNICVECWRKKHGDFRHPEQELPPADDDFCCFCGKLNHDGIYVRHDPDEAPCKGLHQNPTGW